MTGCLDAPPWGGLAPPDPTFTPTIEQVAEALGEPFAHLAPLLDLDASGQQVWSWMLCNQYGLVHPDTAPCISGPTRDEALRAAWAYITSPPASVPDLEPAP